MLKKLPFITIAALSLTFLVGCQTTSLSKVTDRTSINISDAKEVDLNAVPSQQLLERLTYYDWELIQVKDSGGKTKPFHYKPPLVMDVAPDHLSFNKGCQRYQMFTDETYQPPFRYRFSNFKTLSEENCQHSNKSEIQSALERLFIPYGDTAFKFEPLASNQSRPRMALSIKDSATLIFSGKAKTQYHVSGIPITHELLERYRWRLIRATDSRQRPINDFHELDIPILAHFSTDELRQTFGVSVGRHGVGGSYALSLNQTLLTSSDPILAISFGERLDSIMIKFVSMAFRPSQLILNEKKQTIAISTIHPTKSEYLLTQKVKTGETLVWKNEANKTL